MLKTLIIATVLLPTLALAQRAQQLPQPRQPSQWAQRDGWRAVATASPAPTRHHRQFQRMDFVRLAGARAAVIAFAELADETDN
jgi:hypothetical protein